MSPHPWKTRLDWKELFVSTSPTTAPLDYSKVSPYDYREKRSARIVLDSDTDRTEQYLRSILSFIKSDVTEIHCVRGREFDDTEFFRGVLLVDENGSVVVHVVNALIGYNGSGPQLTRTILEMFGFSRKAFETINNAAKSTDGHYALILRIV